jgi:hypothetical protein
LDSHVEHLLRGHGVHAWFALNDLVDSLRTTVLQGNSCDVPRLSTVLIVGNNILFVKMHIIGHILI